MTLRLPLTSTTLPLTLAFVLAGCREDAPPAFGDDSSGDAGTTSTATSVASTGASTSGEGSTGGDTEGGEDELLITHAFGEKVLAPGEDDAATCVSWTLDNELPVYVQAVIMSNEGGFHHSNWLVVPEEDFPGEDGYWPCADRNFSEIAASANGRSTVLFAQSTQSYVEEQRLTQGAVIKLPARHKIIASLHTLNTGDVERSTRLWLSLAPIHPKDVETVVIGMSMQYHDLSIPAMQESRFRGTCDVDTFYQISTGEPLDLKVHYILPHYHYLGNYFDVTVRGGVMDGQSIYQLDGFNGEGNGLTFDPPLHLEGATGLDFTCGYDNWTDQTIEWGNGMGEMCVLLALVESEAQIGATVDSLSHVVEQQDGIDIYEGLCIGVAVKKDEKFGMPTEQEILAPLYLPPVDPDDQDIPPIPECRDAEVATPAEEPATLASLRTNMFGPSCTFSACHGTAMAAGLDLLAADLHTELMNHQVDGNTDLPLVAPGNPEGSWLYQLVSRCSPEDKDGTIVPHMPYNSPILLDDGLVAKLRQWIADGAADN